MYHAGRIQRIVMAHKVPTIARIPLYLVTFVLLGLIFGFLTFKVLSFSRTVEVPDVSGKSLLQANKLLADKGLYLKIEGEDYDAVVPPGNIIRQDIPAGNRVKEQRAIKVIISKGPRITSVPSLVGETLADAEALLIQKGLKLAGVILVHSDDVEKDRVLAQKPTPMDRVGETVTVVVSLGPHERMYYCPDLKGKTLEEASDLARRLRVILSVEGAGETVAEQKPAPGSLIKTGDTIHVQLF